MTTDPLRRPRQRVLGWGAALAVTAAGLLLAATWWTDANGSRRLSSAAAATERAPASPTAAASPTAPPVKRWKVLHVMSYHTPWEWCDEQHRGFQDALAGLAVEYKVHPMDARRRGTPEWKVTAGKQARDLIDSWKPDLVYATDDEAQAYATRYYVDTDVPVVFAALNADPRQYGFVGSRNVTGVLEHEHFVETVRLLRRIAPEVRRVAVIVDDDPIWTGVIARMREQAARQLPDLELTQWEVVHSFTEYKLRVTELQTQVDALGLLGVEGFKDEQGASVACQDVLRWTAENSRLPDFGFWKERVQCGTLCAVQVSPYEQGLAAGRIARGILAERRSPTSFAMQPTAKGQPAVSLARARQLGLDLPGDLPPDVERIERYQWEQAR